MAQLLGLAITTDNYSASCRVYSGNPFVVKPFCVRAKMQALKLKPKNVPECLREIPSWLLWKLKKSRKADGTETWLKVPFYSNGYQRKGALGTKADRSKLVSFERVLEVYSGGGYAGIGFATMPEYPLTILDLDKCIDGDSYSDFAQKVIDTGTYVEKSPSGTGLRAVYTGEAICAGKRNGHIDTGERVEIYCGSAFVTITGHVLDGAVTPRPLPKRIAKTLEPVVNSGVNSAGPKEDDGEGVLMSPDAAPLPELSIDHARVILGKLPEVWGQPGHGTWYRVAAALHLQFDGSEEAYQLLDEWSQGLDGYDEENNRKRWAAGFSHGAGKEGLTTMRNLVFEAIQNGGLKVKAETMQKWGLARKADEDFDADDSEAPVLPEYTDLDRMADIGRMVAEQAPPTEWLVQDFLPRGTVTFLAGGSGTSKSYLALLLTGAAAVGIGEFAGLKIVDGGFRTLYFAYEDTVPVIHHRVHEVSEYLGQQVDILGDGAYKDALRSNLMVLPAEVLDSGAWQFGKTKRRYEPMDITSLGTYLKDYVLSRGIDCLIFDTGSEIHEGDENSAADMVILMRVLRQLGTSTNCAVLVVQHVAKGIWNLRLQEMNQAAIRGSSVLVDKSRNVVMLARMPRADASMFGLPDNSDTHENYVVLKHVKANLGGYVPMQVFERTSRGLLVHRPEIVEGDFGPAVAEEQQEETEQERRAARVTVVREKVLAFLKEQNKQGVRPSSKMVRAWAMGSGVSDAKARMMIDLLAGEGIIRSVEDPDYPKSSNWEVVDNEV